MCIGNNTYPEPIVDFNDTILIGGDCLSEAGEIEHLCGYSMEAQTKLLQSAGPQVGWNIGPAGTEGDFGWHVTLPAKKKGNAMLIAIPAVPGSVNVQSLIPVGKFPNFMADYKRALAPRPKSVSRGISFGLGGDGPAPIVVKGFDNGVYDVVIAPSANSIKSVIAQVDEAKRPELNQPLYNDLSIVYPGFTFLLFCFSEQDSAKAGCTLVKYKPMFPHLLFLPGLDGHNGKIETGNVKLNHTLVVGSYRLQPGASGSVAVRFSDPGLSEACPFLPKNVLGKIIPAGTFAPQGDFLFLLDDVANGVFRCKRELPPGWSNLPGASAPSATPYFI